MERVRLSPVGDQEEHHRRKKFGEGRDTGWQSPEESGPPPHPAICRLGCACACAAGEVSWIVREPWVPQILGVK